MQKQTTQKQNRARKVKIKDMDSKADPKGGPTPIYMSINDTGIRPSTRLKRS